jgi:GTP-binding protein YchF
VGIVQVPDERLFQLAEMSKSKKIVPAVVEFVDIAGLVKGASEGEGLGNKFLANIRETDAIVQVVRVFENSNIIHVHNKIEPQQDIEIINTELILADLDTIKKTENRIEKEKKGGKKGAVEQLEAVQKIKVALESGKLASETELNLEDDNVKIIVREMQLLTMKTFLYVFNVSDLNAPLPPELEKKNHIKLDIKIEEELIEMTPEEQIEMGLESHIGDLVLKAYAILGLMTFLTTGEDESRAWTIKNNSTAPEAGMAIHTDFKERFIKADVVNWEKLLEAGAWGKAREMGWLRTEGKEYVVQDGDVIEFKV